MLEGRKEPVSRPGVFLNPNSCTGFEPEPSKKEWMMAQNDLVVGIDVAKDKVDACIRRPSQRRTFQSSSRAGAS